MQSAPTRNPLVLIASVFGAFGAGPLLGHATAHWSAPGSEVAQLVSPLAFALSFAGGLMLWFGVGAVALVRGFFGRIVRGRPATRREESAAILVPPGYGAFLPLGLSFGLLAGVVAGIVPESRSFAGALLAHAAAGAGYGVLLRTLARGGWLPFPEPG